MGKFFIGILAAILTVNLCNAQDIVLSDIIREAREAQLKQQALSKAQMAMTPVKSNCSIEKGKYNQVKNNAAEMKQEQNAAEKLNPQEILSGQNMQ